MVNMVYRFFPTFKDPEKGNHGFGGFILAYTITGFILLCILILPFADFFLDQYRRNSALIIEYAYLILPLGLVLSIISVFSALSHSLYKTVLPSFLNDIVVRVLLIVLVVIYAFTHLLSFSQFVIGFTSIYVIQLSLLTYYIVRSGNFKLSFKLSYFLQNREMIKYGFVISFATIASLSLKQVDTIFIPKYLDISFAGIYAVVMFIPAIIEAPVFSLEKIGYAKISEAISKGDSEDVSSIYKLSSYYLLFFSGWLFLMVIANLDELMRILPPVYSQASPVIVILSASALFNSFSGLNNGIVMNSGLFKAGTVLLIVSLIITIVMNILLIPVFGITGAALATATGSLVFNSGKLLLIKFKFNMLPFREGTFQFMILIAIASIVVYLLPSYDAINPFVLIFIKVILFTSFYMGILWLLNPGGFRDRMKEIKNLL